MTLFKAAVALVLFAFPVQDDKVTLKCRPRAGDKATSTEKMTMSMELNVTAGGQTQKVKMEQRSTKRQDVELLQVEGDRVVKRTYDVVEDVQETKAPGAPDFARQQKPTHGRKITVSLKDGKTVREGTEGLSEDEANKFDLEDDFARALPDRPVGPGDSWDVTGEAFKAIFDDPGADGKLTLKLASVKDHQGRRCAFLDAQLTLKNKLQGAVDMTLNLKGPLVVWIDRGYLLEGKLEGTASMQAKTPEAEFAGEGPVKMEISFTYK